MEQNKPEIKEQELEKVVGGIAMGGGLYEYTCVNPRCSQYLIYLQMQPAGNVCPVCNGQLGKVLR